MTAPVLAAEPPIDIAPRDWADVLRILQEQVPNLEVWALGSGAKRTAKRSWCSAPWSGEDIRCGGAVFLLTTKPPAARAPEVLAEQRQSLLSVAIAVHGRKREAAL